MASLLGTATLRREQIKLQVALIGALSHVKGFAALETKAAVERARDLIEQAKALGEPPEDPLVLLSVLWAGMVARYVAFNGDVSRDIAAQLLALAKRQETTAAPLIAHRSMATILLCAGEIVQSQSHYDQAIGLCDPVEHRWLAARFGRKNAGAGKPELVARVGPDNQLSTRIDPRTTLKLL